MKPPGFWFKSGLTVPAALMMPLSWLYRAAAGARKVFTKSATSPAPVLCIGNVTLGGAGKTPVALDLGRRLLEAGYNPHYLSRGYGGRLEGPVQVDPTRHTAKDVGDEPLLLARVAPVWVSHDRAAGALAAAAAGASHILMDDGYQNPGLIKDRNILVIDAGVGFGNRAVFPAGPLREPAEAALARADAIVVLGDPGWKARLPVGLSLPVISGLVRPSRLDSLIPGMVCIAFAGIARPQKLFDTLDSLGLAVIHRASYPDHYVYSDQDIADLKGAAQQAGAALVTTEKDWIRLSQDQRADIIALPIHIEWETGVDPLQLLAGDTIP